MSHYLHTNNNDKRNSKNYLNFSGMNKHQDNNSTNNNYDNIIDPNKNVYANSNNIGISQPLHTSNSKIMQSNQNNLPNINSKSNSFLNKGKSVLGIQPISNNNYEENIRKDELTKKKFDEINNNLDEFRSEVINTMRKINKNQSKLKVDSVVEELSDFKNTFIDTLEKAERRKNEENDFILKEVKNLKNEVKRNYEEGKANYKVIRSFQDDIFDFEREITNRISRMESYQSEQFDKIFGLINNLTLLNGLGGVGNEKTKNLKEAIDKEIYNNENKNDRDLDKNLVDRLENIQAKNSGLEEDVKKDSNNVFNKALTTDLKDQMRIKDFDERNKEMPMIRHKINKSNLKMKLKARNKVMSIFRAAYALNKLRLNNLQITNSVKLDALNFFVNYTKTCTATIEDWMRESTKTAIQSILKFESLEMDMSGYTAVGANPPPEVKDTFIRLQTKIKGVIESVGNSIFSHPLDLTTMTWIRIPITNNYIVPFEFYYNFILCRIPLSFGEVVHMETSHQLMILSTYLFITIFVGKIIAGEIKASKSEAIKANLKMLGSAFYYSLMKFFKERVKSVNLINDYKDFCKNQCKDRPELELKFNKNSSVEYRKALKKYYEKYEKNRIDKYAQAQNLLEKVSGKFHIPEKDGNSNDINEISSFLCNEKSMNVFFKMCDMNNFKMSNYLLNVSNTFLKKVYATEG